MGKTRETANLVSTNNLFVDITNERVGVGTNLPTSTLDVNGNVTATGNVTVNGNLNVSGVSTFQDNVFLGDNDELVFGNGNDLRIYHDGSSSYISDQGTGNLKVLTSTFVLKNAVDNKTMLQAVPGQSVKLYYDDAIKLETTGTGVTITGTVEDSKGEVRTIPQSTNTTIVASDAGKYVSVATTITINSSTGFSVGEAVTIFNNSASQIGINTGTVTMYQAGTANTGVRTLDQRGLATILCVGTDTYVISGAGLA